MLSMKMRKVNSKRNNFLSKFQKKQLPLQTKYKIYNDNQNEQPMALLCASGIFDFISFTGHTFIW